MTAQMWAEKQYKWVCQSRREPRVLNLIQKRREVVLLREELSIWFSYGKLSALKTCIYMNITQREQVIFRTICTHTYINAILINENFSINFKKNRKRDIYDGRKRRGKYYSFIMIPSNVLNTNQSVVIFFIKFRNSMILFCSLRKTNIFRSVASSLKSKYRVFHDKHTDWTHRFKYLASI